MVKMINAIFGTEMWVDDARVTEYEDAGHTRAEDPVPARPIGFAAGEDAPKRKTGRKAPAAKKE